MSEHQGLYEWLFGPALGPIIRNVGIIILACYVIFTCKPKPQEKP